MNDLVDILANDFLEFYLKLFSKCNCQYFGYLNILVNGRSKLFKCSVFILINISIFLENISMLARLCILTLHALMANVCLRFDNISNSFDILQNIANLWQTFKWLLWLFHTPATTQIMFSIIFQNAIIILHYNVTWRALVCIMSYLHDQNNCFLSATLFMTLYHDLLPHCLW